MNHQRIMKKIMEELTAYKREIDELATSYLAEKAKREKELSEMQGKYTESYIEESRKNWQPKIDYGKIIALAREIHQKTAENYLDEAKNELDKYFQVPVDSGFAATVSAIKALGVTLKNKEFEVLQCASGGYWGLRLLNELGTSRSKVEQHTVIDNGDAKGVEIEHKTPYSYVNLPDIEAAYNSLQSVKNAVDIAFEAYCGSDHALKDVVFPEDRYTEGVNAKLKEQYGLEPPKLTMNAVQISKMASAERFFDENYRAYTEFSDIMDALAATMPKPKRKEALTKDDKALIDKLIDPRYPSLAQAEAVSLAKADKYLAELLRLDSRYGAAVKAALGEISENE
ncbi:MAG: hypothetical protein NC541_08750 [bacterium]|nr:hypothetical protein [bacterium]